MTTTTTRRRRMMMIIGRKRIPPGDRGSSSDEFRCFSICICGSAEHLCIPCGLRRMQDAPNPGMPIVWAN
eukprot:5049759-Heterocapsa_arctica.AAC.1